MISDPFCPICGYKDWEVLGSQQFKRPDKDCDKSKGIRLEILLEEWNQNTSSVEIKWILCQHCGFCCYRPRPTSEEVSIKYQKIAEKLSNKKLPDISFVPATPYDENNWKKSSKYKINNERADELYALLKEFLVKDKNYKVLDFGGSTGAILEYFVKNGFECHVVDYGCRNPLSGVTYAGPTLHDNDYLYDIAILNHVLEHVADPKQDLIDIKGKMLKGGILFIEVPFELWNKKTPKPSEPVTHINKFSVQSLSSLISRSGFECLGCYYGSFRKNNGKKSLAVKAICKKPDADHKFANIHQPNLNSLKLLQQGNISALLEEYMPESFYSYFQRS